MGIYRNFSQHLLKILSLQHSAVTFNTFEDIKYQCLIETLIQFFFWFNFDKHKIDQTLSEVIVMGFFYDKLILFELK